MIVARNTETWWACNRCRKPLIRVGGGLFLAVIHKHRKVCDPTAGGFLTQRAQTKGLGARKEIT